MGIVAAAGRAGLGIAFILGRHPAVARTSLNLQAMDQPIAFFLCQEFAGFGTVWDEEDGNEARDDGKEAFDDEDPVRRVSAKIYLGWAI